MVFTNEEVSSKIIFILIQFAWRRDVNDYIIPEKENTPTNFERIRLFFSIQCIKKTKRNY